MMYKVHVHSSCSWTLLAYCNLIYHSSMRSMIREITTELTPTPLLEFAKWVGNDWLIFYIQVYQHKILMIYATVGIMLDAFYFKCHYIIVKLQIFFLHQSITHPSLLSFLNFFFNWPSLSFSWGQKSAPSPMAKSDVFSTFYDKKNPNCI